MGYVSFPIETNPDDILRDAYNYIKTRAPSWRENDGNLDTWILQVNASSAADLRALASDVPDTIFRYFGAKLLGVPPIDATPATADSTWTMKDNQGYLIEEGTYVGLRNVVGEIIPFRVQVDVIVPPGSTVTAVGGVPLIAVTAGVAGSGLGAPGSTVELITTLEFVTGAILVDQTTGGVDAESVDAYNNRLVLHLSRLSTRPILPIDFSNALLDIPGIQRAVTIDGYNPNANELQQITVNATSGTLKLTFDNGVSSQQTGTIAWNADAATVLAALVALSTIAPGDVIVTGGPLATNPIVVEFAGAYDAVNVAQMTADSTSLAGGTHSTTIVTLREGSPRFNVERMVSTAPIDINGANVSSGLKAQADAKLQANREINFIVNIIDPKRSIIDVTFAAKAIRGHDPPTVKAAAEAAVASYLNPAKWGRDPAFTDSSADRTWQETPVLRFFEIAQVISNVEGLDYITSLQIAKNPAALGGADVTLDTPAALTQAGAIIGAVTAP